MVGRQMLEFLRNRLALGGETLDTHPSTPDVRVPIIMTADSGDHDRCIPAGLNYDFINRSQRLPPSGASQGSCRFILYAIN